jgi:hypothetical protein
MTATAQVQVNGSVVDLPSGQKALQASVSSANANGTTQSLVLANGVNTITLPTSPAPQGCLIKLPTGNIVATTYKGIAGDTGTVMDPDGYWNINFNPLALPASFVLFTAAIHTAGATEISFY